MKTLYPFLDIFKFICAILIVFMHTYCHDWGNMGQWFVDTFCQIGVPFFFITSGFFYAKGLFRNNNKDDRKLYFINYLRRVSIMYIAWSIITLPIAFLIIERGHGEYTVFLKFAYLIRLFLFTGSIGIYWYVLALVYNCVLIYFAQKKQLIKPLFIISIILWIFGVLYNSPYNDGGILFKSVHIIFGSERNFLMVGLFYMLIGYYFAQNESKTYFHTRSLLLIFIILIVLRTIEINLLHIHSLQALLAIYLFLIALNINTHINFSTIQIRELSTAIYLQHFPFILLFDFYLKKGTILDFSSALFFSITIHYIFKLVLNNKIYHSIYG